jgi:hypothetical protein
MEPWPAKFYDGLMGNIEYIQRMREQDLLFSACISILAKEGKFHYGGNENSTNLYGRKTIFGVDMYKIE